MILIAVFELIWAFLLQVQIRLEEFLPEYRHLPVYEIDNCKLERRDTLLLYKDGLEWDHSVPDGKIQMEAVIANDFINIILKIEIVILFYSKLYHFLVCR